MQEEAIAIRRDLSRVRRPYIQSPYPREIRLRINRFVSKYLEHSSWNELSQALGLKAKTLMRWHDVYLRDSDAATIEDVGESFLPVALAANVEAVVSDDEVDIHTRLSIHTPGGYRLEGLSRDDALSLFERLP